MSSHSGDPLRHRPRMADIEARPHELATGSLLLPVLAVAIAVDAVRVALRRRRP